MWRKVVSSGGAGGSDENFVLAVGGVAVFVVCRSKFNGFTKSSPIELLVYVLCAAM